MGSDCGLNERDEKAWREIANALAEDPEFVRNTSGSGKSEIFNGVTRVLRRLNWRTVLGIWAAGAAAAATFYAVGLVHDGQEKKVVRQGVERALEDPEVLRVTGSCALVLIERAEEVDHILQGDSNKAIADFGIGPTGNQLRQAAFLADQYQVPCVTSEDGVWTYTINGQSVNIQRDDILWQNPSVS